MFDNFFAQIGPIWSAVALVPLLVAAISVVAADTARRSRPPSTRAAGEPHSERAPRAEREDGAGRIERGPRPGRASLVDGWRRAVHEISRSLAGLAAEPRGRR
jgi:hypothetical protein